MILKNGKFHSFDYVESDTIWEGVKFVEDSLNIKANDVHILEIRDEGETSLGAYFRQGGSPLTIIK